MPPLRRGDYLNRSPYNPICSLEYYHAAIDLFEPDTAFLVFSDDLQWCQQTFTSDRFTFAQSCQTSYQTQAAQFGQEQGFLSMTDTQIDENSSEEIDLYLMSLCQHQIIANSTFSWWGSWLNQNPHKTVVAPQTWFGSRLQHWLRVEREILDFIERHST